MRNILFRARHVNNGSLMANKWVNGDLCHFSDGIPFIRERKTGYCFEVVPETVGQLTGMKDSKENPIFEGDILRDLDGGLRYVSYDEEGGKFVEVYHCFKTRIDTKILEFLEVSGNIHDNPELVGLK